MPDEFGREFEADAGEAIDKDSRTWGMLAHLSGLIAAIVGGGVLGFVGPLVVWLTKNNEDPFVDDQGKEALNFHLTFTLAYVVLGVAVAVTCGLAVVVVIVAAPIMILLQVIFSLIAALQANEGKYYRYPMNIRMIKQPAPTMANPRALDKRRKSVRNIRKITRTMELIATARFKKAMDRATSASAYTERMTKLVTDLARSGTQVSHPLMQPREETNRAILLVLTANRGLCGGYNGNIVRHALARWSRIQAEIEQTRLEVSGKRGISAFRYRKLKPTVEFTHFEDRPRYEEVEVIASRYLDEYTAGRLDRVDVAYMQFHSVARQVPLIETLLPLGSLTGSDEMTEEAGVGGPTESGPTGGSMYEFLPSAEAILEEVVPASFKVKLFTCFLNAAVSEQVARMVAMKSATENAGELIKQLSMTYNRARQTKITNEIMEVIGGVEALSK